MNELGSLLREAREAKGLTLVDVQEATRINPKYLEALEDGHYDVLPSEVHVKGYLRNYARFLELDPKPLLDRYAIDREKYVARSTNRGGGEYLDVDPIPQNEDPVFFDPVNVEINGTSRRGTSSSALWIIIILALLASIALIANRFLPILTGNGDSNNGFTNSLEEAVNNITNEIDQQEPTPEGGIIPGVTEPITSTSRNSTIQLPTPTATRPTLPATMEEILLRLEITERTWMQITIDGEVVFEGLAVKGDGPFEWQAQEEARLLTGNAIGVFVTVNDVELGKLGDRGEVIDETWTTTSSG